MAAESILTQALSDVIAEFNRRGVVYALAGGWTYSALVEPRATTDIDLLILLDQPSRDTLQSLVSPLFDSTVIHPAPMVFRGLSIWQIVGIRSDQEILVDLLLADSTYLRTALARARRVTLGLLSVPVLAIEDLIILKLWLVGCRIALIWRKSRCERPSCRLTGLMWSSGKRPLDLLMSKA